MSSQPQTPATGSRPRVETRSIDYVPQAERHGKVWHQGPFWFTGNFVITTMVTGFIGPAAGLPVIWCILAITVGVLLGTFFMAFHANQGPRLGLPQMIQSRAQFGSRGAVLPFAAVVFVYVGFIVFDLILASQIMEGFLPVSTTFWAVALAVLGLLVAIVGYDLLHFLQRWLSYLLIPAFALFTVAVITAIPAGSELTNPEGFSLTAFLVQLTAAAGYQISYSVYVSDYSRYLPKNTPARQVISWTYVGAAASAIWMMSLGSLLAGAVDSPDVVSSTIEVGNGFIPGFGLVLAAIALPALIGQFGVNSYGAMLTSASGIDAFRSLRPTLKLRIVLLSCVMAIAVLIAVSIPEDYLDSFDSFVSLMLFFLIPWTSVNLVDFYLVRRGRYAVTHIFKDAGVYRRWSFAGMGGYLAGIVAGLPFLVLPFFEGPVAQLMGGIDLSFVVSLAVSAGTYWLLATRSIRPDDEERAYAESAAELGEE